MEHKVLKVMLQGVEGRNAVSGSSMLAPEQVWDLLEHVWEFGCGHEGRVGVGNTLWLSLFRGVITYPGKYNRSGSLSFLEEPGSCKDLEVHLKDLR